MVLWRRLENQWKQRWAANAAALLWRVDVPNGLERVATQTKQQQRWGVRIFGEELEVGESEGKWEVSWKPP